MKTQAAGVQFALDQIDQRLDFDGKWGAQCVDLIRFYMQYLGCAQPGSVNGAADFVNRKWPEGFSFNDTPQPGDIAVFGGIPTNKYGHTSIVVSVSPDGRNFESVDQNWVGSSPDKGSAGKRVPHPSRPANRKMTYIRPNFDAPANAPQQPQTLSRDLIGRRVMLPKNNKNFPVYKPGTNEVRAHLDTRIPTAQSYQIREIDSLANSVIIRSGLFGNVAVHLSDGASV